MKKQLRSIIVLLTFSALWSCHSKKNFNPEEISIIPKPAHMEVKEGTFQFDKNTKFIVENADQKAIADQLAKKFGQAAGFKPEISIGKEGGKNTVLYTTVSENNPEGYTLDIENNQILITASSSPGFFYATQTLRQLLPIEIEGNKPGENIKWWVPNISIADSSRFEWRGFMLDVARHFFPKEYIKDLIDYLAMHKINTFHWHLIDDQGWRIEIKKYPKLTEVGAWRVDREDIHWNNRPPQKEGEKSTYGGYYTQEDIKEIVAYARSKQVTIVPEIEMPAHVTSGLAAYPEFTCAGKPLTVPPGGLWPITDIYCAGNDATFAFLEDVLTEVMDLFPSEYIHIGGDEATKTEWQKCPKCLKRIRNEGLKDVEELQSYFIKRIEKFLNEKGRKLIGWDEILEGGLAPEATVMSWRGFEGGIEAAEQGHDVVMTPVGICYFNMYQGPVDMEPIAWGGYTPLNKVYGFDPIPNSMDEEVAKHVLGGQANLWTEYVKDKELAMYMTFPRLAALAEKLWTPEDKTDWADFTHRLTKLLQRYEIMDVNYAKSLYLVQANAEMSMEDKTVLLTLSNELPDPDIRYVTGDKDLTKEAIKYTEPIEITETTVIKAALFEYDKILGKIFIDTINFHKSVGKTVEYLEEYSDSYKGQGPFTLTDAIRGSKNFHDGKWQGWIGNDLDVVIDLEEEKTINTVSVGTLESQGSGIYFPIALQVWTSVDGENYITQGIINRDYRPNVEATLQDFVVAFEPTKARYLKVKATNLGSPPKGGGSWLFIDEISVQ